MENKFEDLHAELVNHLCEMFIDDQCSLRDKKSFMNDPQLDILILKFSFINFGESLHTKIQFQIFSRLIKLSNMHLMTG
jgi:hypothetical protein